MQVWLSYWRDVLLRAAGASAPLTNVDREQEITTLAQQLNLDIARRTVASIERISKLLDHNINTRLAADVLLLDLPKI